MPSKGRPSAATLAVLAATSIAGCGAETRGDGGATGGAFPIGTGGFIASGGNVSTGGSPSSGGSSGSSPGGAGGTPSTGGASGDAGDASIDGRAPDGGSIDGGPVIGPPVPPPTPVGCLTAAHLTPGVHQVSCDTTTHVVTVPEQCTTNACGVIVDVHGGMMSSQMEDENTNLSALGVQYGFLVIQPNALQNFALLNQRLFVADTPTTPADDTRVMNILTDVIDAFHANTDRIHMTGFSEGGYMTWRWYCQHSDLLASIAPGAAAWNCANLAALGLVETGCIMTGDQVGTEVPERHLPTLYIHGTNDGLVDPQCSTTWLENNVFPTLELDAGTEIAGDGMFTRTRYLGSDGVPFEYIVHDYETTSAFLGFALLGHCYPGSADLTATPAAQTVIPPDQLIPFGCNDPSPFKWGEEVMKFFIAHPKQ